MHGGLHEHQSRRTTHAHTHTRSHRSLAHRWVQLQQARASPHTLAEIPPPSLGLRPPTAPLRYAVGMRSRDPFARLLLCHWQTGTTVAKCGRRYCIDPAFALTSFNRYKKLTTQPSVYEQPRLSARCLCDNLLASFRHVYTPVYL